MQDLGEALLSIEFFLDNGIYNYITQCKKCKKELIVSFNFELPFASYTSDMLDSLKCHDGCTPEEKVKFAERVRA